MIANTRSGIVDKMRSHLQPKVGIIASAIATSKQAPSAQKHYKNDFIIVISTSIIMYISNLFIKYTYVHLTE